MCISVLCLPVGDTQCSWASIKLLCYVFLGVMLLRLQYVLLGVIIAVMLLCYVFLGVMLLCYVVLCYEFLGFMLLCYVFLDVMLYSHVFQRVMLLCHVFMSVKCHWPTFVYTALCSDHLIFFFSNWITDDSERYDVFILCYWALLLLTNFCITLNWNEFTSPSGRLGTGLTLPMFGCQGRHYLCSVARDDITYVRLPGTTLPIGMFGCQGRHYL